jgi:hypothetical protein
MTPFATPPPHAPNYAYPNQHPPFQPYGAAPRPPTRNVALLVVGAVLFLVAALPGLAFAYNAYHYATAESRFADVPGGGAWIIDVVKEADLHRMMVFGPVAFVFGVAALVCGGLGLRKR